MSKTINMVVRSKPIISTPESEGGWDWNRVNKNKKPPSIFTKIKLLFIPWKTILAPKGTPYCLKNGKGLPIYRFKEINGTVYKLEMRPSPGFPGS